MKKYLLLLIFLFLSATFAGAVDLNKNVADTAEMKTMNASLRSVQNQYGPIVFVTGKADLDVAKCKKTLDTVASIVKKYPRFLVTVEGHTDNVGNKSANLTLSQKRAEAVTAWLVSSGGVEKKQLKAKGYGDTKPIANNKTEDGRNKNRRVDFQVSKL
jgi:outer membrane protein OmpA-like peptidoglycan-associated protein